MQLSKEDVNRVYSQLVKEYGSGAVINICNHIKVEHGLVWSNDMSKIVEMAKTALESKSE